jgi:hypothetical protein
MTQGDGSFGQNNFRVDPSCFEYLSMTQGDTAEALEGWSTLAPRLLARRSGFEANLKFLNIQAQL